MSRDVKYKSRQKNNTEREIMNAPEDSNFGKISIISKNILLKDISYDSLISLSSSKYNMDKKMNIW